MQTTDAKTPTQTDLLTHIRQPIADDLKATDHLVCHELISRVPLIQTITQHIVNSGGKRLRPLLVLLSARACGYQQDDNEHHELAAIIEFVHTATLLHDDVIDESKLRRGKATANAQWGNQASVLVGDFLYSRAFQILARRHNIPVMKCLADTTNAIAEGEVWQLMNQNNPDISIDDYYQVIHHKTAKLFASAAEIGAMIAGQNQATQKAMANYGLQLGMAFQILDDLLDYCSDAKTMGKNIGDDLAEGKVTLPLIYAMQHATPHQRDEIRHAITNASIDNFQSILQTLKTTKAIDYSRAQAQHYADQALVMLDHLEPSAYREALSQLVTFAIARSY